MKEEKYNAETLAIICSLSEKNLLPQWFYYLDWMSEEARILTLEIMYSRIER